MCYRLVLSICRRDRTKSLTKVWCSCRLYKTFDYGSNASHLALAELSINTNISNAGNLFPSQNSASTDTTSYSNATEPHPTALLLVGSDAMHTVSHRRQKKSANYACHLPGCTATFTGQHNYGCPYFFTGNISSN